MNSSPEEWINIISRGKNFRACTKWHQSDKMTPKFHAHKLLIHTKKHFYFFQYSILIIILLILSHIQVTTHALLILNKYYMTCMMYNVPVVKKNPLVDVNSFLVMTSQIVNRCQAQLSKINAKNYQNH